jgi:hypothetical protein
VKACRKLGSWRQSQGTSGGPGAELQAQARSQADGTCRQQAPQACGSCAVLVDGTEAGRGTQDPNSGCRGRREGVTGGARELAYRVRVGPTKSARARAWDTGPPFGAVMLAAAGGAAPTASPPRVEDAGNGYSTSSWTVTCGNSGESASGSAGPVAAVGKARASSLGVGCFGGCS